MSLHIPFDNSYARLPERFHQRIDPVPVAEPALFALNAPLARAMGLDPEALSSPEGVAMFAGNHVPAGAEPLAQAYAGHQFGGWVPQLGDGRAVLLGEVNGPDGAHWDIQLKGSGRTRFSRGGDGRAWLGPVLREYLVSEAMAALGVPTTRALAAVTTGETLLREAALPGAVLCRVAPSHLRVGTFQYFAARSDTEALGLLVDMAIARHYPGATGALGLLGAAVAAQAALIARWMGLGFIHGVMNTDNAHVGGITIDYGPCAFMEGFEPAKVFSSIDRGGRYAWRNQPQIAVWNMAQLATSLLPLIDADREHAISLATAAVEGFASVYDTEWRRVFGAKIGLAAPGGEDDLLIDGYLGLMAAQAADFTIAFRALAEGEPERAFADPAQIAPWIAEWRARISHEPGGEAEARALMLRSNPAVIPRNHRVEEAITAAVAGDAGPFLHLQAALQTPFEAASDDPLRLGAQPEEAVTQTFCGT